jgi:hypothetical protein
MSWGSLSLWNFLSSITKIGYYISISSYTSCTMFFGLKDLLLHPDAFFARVAQGKVNLIPPLVIVGAGMFLNFLGLLLTLGFYKSLISPEFYSHISGGLVGSFICYSLITPLVIWGFFSFSLYGISRLFAGEGSLPATIQNVGYGMIPLTVSALVPVITSVVTIYNYYAFLAPRISWNMLFPWDVFPGDDSAPIGFFVLLIIGVVVFIWMWYLWILAVRHTHQFTMRKAAIITVVPVAIYVGVTTPVVYYSEWILRIVTRT